MANLFMGTNTHSLTLENTNTWIWHFDICQTMSLKCCTNAMFPKILVCLVSTILAAVMRRFPRQSGQYSDIYLYWQTPDSFNLNQTVPRFLFWSWTSRKLLAPSIAKIYFMTLFVHIVKSLNIFVDKLRLYFSVLCALFVFTEADIYSVFSK